MSAGSRPQNRDNSFVIIGVIVIVAVIAVILIVFGGSSPLPASEVTRQTNAQFLAENGARDGVTTTASGLQYEAITEAADGTSPVESDRVTVHYEGRLLDGTVFDSSYDRGQPATFGLGQVISGWTEGLQYMTVGDKYTFWIPSELAYGQNPPQGSGIPVNALLVFDVELLGINGDPQ
jgi:FKBP-type peptidyl-prolyl cis-trans isomerase